MPSVWSSAIAAIDYHAAERALIVTFTTKRRYVYAGVPPDIHAAFLASESKGAFFNERIRDNYPTAELAERRRS